MNNSIHYLDRIEYWWETSIDKAKKDGANAIQLECMEDLALCEFVAGSDMRLRDDCFWETFIDTDGDVVLSFINAADTSNHDGWNRVQIYIDHAGILTVKDLNADKVYINSPKIVNPDDFPKDFLITAVNTDIRYWELDREFFKAFTVKGLTFGITDFDKRYCYARDIDFLFWPFLFGPDSAIIHGVQPEVSNIVWHTSTGGQLKYRNKCHYFKLIFEDVVSSDKIYGMYTISFFQKIKQLCSSSKSKKKVTGYCLL